MKKYYTIPSFIRLLNLPINAKQARELTAIASNKCKQKNIKVIIVKHSRLGKQPSFPGAILEESFIELSAIH